VNTSIPHARQSFRCVSVIDSAANTEKSGSSVFVRRTGFSFVEAGAFGFLRGAAFFAVLVDSTLFAGLVDVAVFAFGRGGVLAFFVALGVFFAAILP
jgi:hypothetical protein